MISSNDVRAISGAAAQALRAGRAAEAALLFRRLAELQPGQPNHWFNLGYSLRMSRQYEPALEAYGEALARGVTGPEDVHINRAAILSEHLHDIPAATAELRKAVEANPRALLGWINLGGLYDDLGETAAARDAYQSALQAHPTSGRAMARLAAIDVHDGRAGVAEAMLRAALERGSLHAEDRAEIHFALGNALDASGHYPDAFETIVEANRIGAALQPPTARYDPQAQERLIDALIAMPPLETAGSFPADESPIFICGMFRSGSTLVEQLLARHPKITAGGELEFIPAIVQEDLQPYPQALAEAGSDRLRELRDKYLEQLRRLYPNAERISDKRPDNALHIGLIKALFPAARIVHTRRNALDNILSAFFLYFGDVVSYSLRLEDIAHYYVQQHRLMAHWKERFPGDIHDVDYDALVTDPRAELEPLIRFLGFDWDEACLSHGPTNAVRTASNWQVRKPLHAKSSGRWRNYAQELDPVRRLLTEAGLADD
jgi:tetratricopeptide (TPR) repeat protein